MTDEESREDRRIWQTKTIEGNSRSLALLHEKVDSLKEKIGDSNTVFEGRIATLTERLRWISVGVSTGVSIIVSAIVGAILFTAKSALAFIIAKVG